MSGKFDPMSHSEKVLTSVPAPLLAGGGAPSPSGLSPQLREIVSNEKTVAMKQASFGSLQRTLLPDGQM